MDIIDFDAEKLYLGKLCKAGHEWGTTRKSLRRKCNSECPKCRKEKYLYQIQQDPDFNKKRYQANREYSINYLHQYRKNNSEIIRQKNKEYQQKHRKKLLAYRKAYDQKHREKLLPKRREYRRNYYLEHKEEINKKHRDYYRKNSYAALLRSRKRRAIKKNLHSVRYTVIEVKFLKESFESCCAYCGCKKPLALDHFIPIAKGGPDCLGNLVPACKSCNSSKHDSDPMEWYKSQQFYSVKRWRKILKVLGKKESNYRQLPLL